VAEVPGLKEADLQKYAEDAKKGCPVSKALDGPEIRLKATLVKSHFISGLGFFRNAKVRGLVVNRFVIRLRRFQNMAKDYRIERGNNLI
jgi:hypothetical protein